MKLPTRRTWLTSLLFLCLSQTAAAEPWQNITQPIGTLLVNPPESALSVNLYLMSLDKNITPATFPFDPGTNVTKIMTSQTLYFVRVYDEATGSRPAGSWIMRASEARGLNAAQIRNIQALPDVPTKFTFVKVPAGITLYTGIAGPIVGWGDGGANQSKVMGPPYVPEINHINQQLIGDCLLCYRVLAPSGNAHRVGAAFDRGTPTPYSSLDTLYNNLDMIYFAPNAGRLQDALNSLSGEGATASQSVAFGNNALFMEAIRQNTANWVTSAGAIREKSGAKGNSELWANLTGGTSFLRGDNGTASVNASGAGVQIGLNRQLNPNVLVGAALGLANSSYSVNDRSSKGTLNGLNAGLYGVAKSDNLYFSGTLGYAWSDTGSDRNVSVNELSNAQRGSFASQILSVRLETGYVARLESSNLTPFVALEPAWLWQGAFSENMRSSNTPVNMGLDYRSQQISSLPLSLGVQWDSNVSLENGWTLSPVMRLSWIHEFNPTRQADASLQLMPSQSFTVYGASAPENMGRLVLGLSGTSRAGLTGYVMLDANVSDRGQAFGARAGLSLLF